MYNYSTKSNVISPCGGQTEVLLLGAAELPVGVFVVGTRASNAVFLLTM